MLIFGRLDRIILINLSSLSQDPLAQSLLQTSSLRKRKRTSFGRMPRRFSTVESEELVDPVGLESGAIRL